MAEDSGPGPWLRASASDSEWLSILADVQFAISHTVNKLAQIERLKECIVLHSNLVSLWLLSQFGKQGPDPVDFYVLYIDLHTRAHEGSARCAIPSGEHALVP